MSTLFASLFRFLAPRGTPPLSPAATLLEQADASAGLDPRRAQELRTAASAWLRVIR